jgi:hypothetical protein
MSTMDVQFGASLLGRPAPSDSGLPSTGMGRAQTFVVLSFLLVTSQSPLGSNSTALSKPWGIRGDRDQSRFIREPGVAQ